MYVQRELKKKFDMMKNITGIIALVGARQSGKTTFLQEHAKQVKSNYVLFDDPEARRIFSEDIKMFERKYMKGFDVTVLDELQNCKDAGTKLKFLCDTGHKMWVTSSSESLLEAEVLSYLVGRVSIMRLFPFSLREVLNARDEIHHDNIIRKRIVNEHMLFGGYPKVVLAENQEVKKNILRDIYQTMMLKDTVNAFSIEDSNTLDGLAEYLSFAAGGVISYDKISQSVSISFRTLKKYIDAMEKSYLVRKVRPFFRNKTKELIKQPKIYFIDNGMLNLLSNNLDKEPRGYTFENYVFTELLKSGFKPKYWRTKAGAEVDFIIEKGKEIVPIEVKFKMPNKAPTGLRTFINSYKPKKAYVVAYDGKTEKKKINGCNVFFVDVYDLIGKITENK